MKLKMLSMFFPATILLAGCVSDPEPVMEISTVSTVSVAENVSQPTSSTSQTLPPRVTFKLTTADVKSTVEHMVKSLDSDEALIREVAGGRPVLDIALLKSRIRQRIDLRLITNSIRTQLIRSRKFRFVDDSTADVDLAFMNNQALNGMVDPSKVIPTGKQSAAQMYLYGDIRELVNPENAEHYYKVTLNLKDLRSGEIVWTDEKDILLARPLSD